MKKSSTYLFQQQSAKAMWDKDNGSLPLRLRSESISCRSGHRNSNLIYPLNVGQHRLCIILESKFWTVGVLSCLVIQ